MKIKNYLPDSLSDPSSFVRLVLLCLFFILMAVITHAQIVPNGSFESSSAIPNTYDQIDLATPWVSATSDGTPEYFHRNANTTTPVYLPRPSQHEFGVQDVDVNWGHAYAGINIGETVEPLQNVDNWEYISIPLEYGGLDPTKSYTISFKVNIIDHNATHNGLAKPSIDIPIDGISAFLFNTTTYPNFVLANRTTGVPLDSYVTGHPLAYEVKNTSVISDENNWVTVTGQIPIRSGGDVLNHLIIGSFLSEAELRTRSGVVIPSDPVGTYAFIDDVKIVEDVSNGVSCDCDDIEFTISGTGQGSGCRELDISMPPGCQNSIEEIVVTVIGDITSANKGGTITTGSQAGSEVITWDRDYYSGKYEFCFSGTTIGSVLIQLKDDLGNEVCRRMINCSCNGYEWSFDRDYDTPDSSCCYTYRVKKISDNACEIFGFGVVGDIDFGESSFLSPTPILPNVGDEMTLGPVCFDKTETSVELELYDDTPDPYSGFNIQCDFDYDLEGCPDACCENISIDLLQSPGNNPDCIDVRAIFDANSCAGIAAISITDNLNQTNTTLALTATIPGNQHLGSYCCNQGVIDLVIHFLDNQGDTLCHKIVTRSCAHVPSCCDVITPVLTAVGNQITHPANPFDVLDTVRCCWDITVPWMMGEFCEIGGWLLLNPGDAVPNTVFNPNPQVNLGVFCSDDFALDVSPVLAPGQSQSDTLHLSRVLAIYDVNGDLLCTEEIIDSCVVTFYGAGGGSFGPGKNENTTGVHSLTFDKGQFRVAPNPAESRTIIYYSLNKPDRIKLSLHNSVGELVEVIQEGNRESGEYSLSYSVADLPMGIYYIFIQTNTEQHSLPVHIVH